VLWYFGALVVWYFCILVFWWNVIARFAVHLACGRDLCCIFQDRPFQSSINFEALLVKIIVSIVSGFVLSMLLAGQVQADDKEALMAAMLKSFDAGSFRVRMIDDSRRAQLTTMEFQAPDRFRVVTDDTEIVAVDGTAYMVVGGRTMRVPMDVGSLIGRFRIDEEIRKAQDGMTVTAVEDDVLNGEKATRYDFLVDKPKSTNRAWVSEESGYLMRMEQTSGSGRRQTTTTMDYEDFGNVEVRAPAP
jgi:outer membrane lipoprotein-sorting protein